ncbi:MAG: hypothetical protein MJ068_00265 [Clostridia bacterium]|nr:hypothetical protein [Clostridia bacterium]
MKKTGLLCVILILFILTVFFTGCSNQGTAGNIRFAAPEGTPALAMLNFAVSGEKIGGMDVDYSVVSPSNIAAEMSSGKADVVIMPVNAGANLIRQGADYKLVSIAVDGSLYLTGFGGKESGLGIDDIKGSKIVCIGQTGVPGLVFRYVMSKNGIELITSGKPEGNQVLVEYVADGAAAKVRLAGKQADFAVVGEPAATVFRNALACDSEMDMQKMYSEADPHNGDSYPQAGLFVKSGLCTDKAFMDDLFGKLEKNKEFIASNPSDVDSMAKSLYESASFPAPSVSRCAVNGNRLTDKSKEEIIMFLKNVMKKDASGNEINWDAATTILF